MANKKIVRFEIDDKRMNKIIKNYKNLIPLIMNDIEQEIINYFIDRFKFQEFDSRKWKKVDGKTKALIESGKLRRSIKRLRKTKYTTTVGSRLKYADIHNEGGVIKVTSKMKKFFWYKYNKTGLEKYKAMALVDKINIPKRQFIGESRELNKMLKKVIYKMAKKKVKK